MCLIVDTCCISRVFNQDNAEHKHFAPALKWITDGKGKLIYGGTKYGIELRKCGEVLVRTVTELGRKMRLIEIDRDEVDRVAAELRRKVAKDDFDDEHIVALVILSRCCVVCTCDARAFPYLKRRDLYPKDVKRPAIYRGRPNNKDLCCEKYMAEICR